MIEYCLNWDSHKNNICNGFSRLQQNQEFVDMTLAAAGHMVKVHQNIIAVASPYLKGLIQSANCQHPVIFLNGISHEVLCFILEYVYAGEIRLPVDKVNSFFKAAESLCIVGIQDTNTVTGTPDRNGRHCGEELRESAPVKDSIIPGNIHNIETKRLYENNYRPDDQVGCIDDNNINLVPTTVDDDDQSRPEHSKETYVNRCSPIFEISENSQHKDDNTKCPLLEQQAIDGNSANIAIENHAFTIKINPNPEFVPVLLHTENPVPPDKSEQYSISVNSNPEFVAENQNLVTTNSNQNETGAEKNKLSNFLGNLARYSVSNRGALQLVVNRYIYYCHHQSDGGRKLRWRCIDYRRNRCKAYIDSIGDAMTHRKFGHLHPFHDNQILKKINKGKLYDSIIEAQEKIIQERNRDMENVRCRDNDGSDVDMQK